MADASTSSPDEEKIAPEQSETPSQSAERGDDATLQSKVAELELSVAQYKDQLLRKAAEFENYKRRTENDYAAMVRFSTEEMITRLLPILDDFERSMKSTRPQDPSAPGEEGSFYRGVEMIYAKFRKLLESHGVKEMEVLGKPFDPELHDALLQVPNSSVPPHTVLEVVDKGYTLHTKVIRHARVIVSADQQPELPAGGAEGAN
jgi:molecular chaperone GrpE